MRGYGGKAWSCGALHPKRPDFMRHGEDFIVTIIITGAGGFVGRHLVGRLVESGHRVVALDASAQAIPAGARVVAGDLGDAAVRAEALRDGCSAVIHLATVPGGAAEADPAASWRINVQALYSLIGECAHAGDCPRFVYASSIAVFGEPLPPQVDDRTALSPRLIYGGHKAMMEDVVALFSNRGAIEGVTVRLPGILARPKGPSGLKSAFMSDLFHALKAGEAYVCPVSPDATIWAQSIAACVRNFTHALAADPARLPSTRAVTLPALRLRIQDLVDEIARQCGVAPALVRYAPEADLEVAFGAQPPLVTPAADMAGFTHDGDLAALVANALSTLG